MVILLSPEANTVHVRGELQGLGLWTQTIAGDAGSVALSVQPHSAPVSASRICDVVGVREVLVTPSPHPKVDAQGAWEGRQGPPLLMAGPCSVESEAAIHDIARLVSRAGGSYLRGGAFKPRTSPYSFDGHGRDALRWMREAADGAGLGVITEAMGEREVEAVVAVADIVQVGARNMQNFSLLHAIGRTGATVMLKRSSGATISEWLLSGEHLLAKGAAQVIFCERGIRSFDPSTRYLLDLASVVQLKSVYGQTVVVDPSHAVGRRDLILPMALAAAAVGADGLIVEVHPEPAAALSDGPQALTPSALTELSQALGLTSSLLRVEAS